MRRTTKIVIGTILFSLSSSSFAVYDCGLATSNIIDKYAVSSDIGPFDKTALDMVKKHLANNSNCGGKNDIGAESPYLFDQLIDIGFRKLDAYSDETLRYGLIADKEGIKWQEILTDFAKQFSDPEGGKAPVKQNTIGSFIENFSKYRPTNKSGITPDQSTCQVNEYNTLSLYERYIATCEIARCISTQPLATDATQNTKENSTTALEKNNPCSDITTNRFITEASYAKQLLTRVGVRAITSTLSSYTDNYFITNRRQTLFDKMTLFDQYMTFVNHKVQEGTRSCSK